MFFVSGLKPAPIEFNVKIFYLLSFIFYQKIRH